MGQEAIDSKQVLFQSIMELEDFIYNNIEIIAKKQDKEYFETIYIQQDRLKNLKEMKHYFKAFCFSVKVNDNYWIRIHEEVINCVLNNIRTDELIEMFLKNNERHYVVSRLIAVNQLIESGGIEMKKRTLQACKSAEEVVNVVETYKLTSYRNKLIRAVGCK